MRLMARIGIVGGGAFGTAMACVVRRSGHQALLWAREPEVVAAINATGRNDQFLSGVELAPGIHATGRLAEAADADLVLARRISSAIGNPRFCVHPSDDLIGTALGGVMKNVVAIASGVAAGRKLGENARATVVTLGLAEAVRLGLALGARRETFDGFAGIGDMMLTANSLQSRNTSLGVALAEGRSAQDVLSTRLAVTEGAFSAGAVVALASRLGVDMPISQAVDQVLNHGADLDAMIARFLPRGTLTPPAA